MNEKIEGYLKDLVRRYPVLEGQKETIWNAYEAMAESYQNGGKLLVAGNGGSAADAEHIAGELMKGFIKPRKLDEQMMLRLEKADPENGRMIGEKLQGALPAIAVVDHIALSTAYLNDVDPMLGFAQQVYGYGEEGDVFLGISTSGNSRNILYACAVARAKGVKVIGLMGRYGGQLKDAVDIAIVVPAMETYQIQELHLPVYHALCLMLEERFFGGGNV